MIPRAEIEQSLRRIGALSDDRIDLAETALLLAARDRPGVGLDRYRRHLDRLASDIANTVGGTATVEDRAARLAALFSERYAYRGDTLTYDDLQNANLMRVIDRRKGLPVALGILYIHAARAQGWDMAGLAFPAHFLARLDFQGRRLIVDPFDGGKVLDVAALRRLLKHSAGDDAELEPGHYEPVGDRAVLIRLQNNIKSRALRRDDVARAIDVLGCTLMFAPRHAPSWRELGYLQAHRGNVRDGIKALERFIAMPGHVGGRHQVAVYIQQLRARLD